MLIVSSLFAFISGLEILAGLVFLFGNMVHAKSIPIRGKHLDELEGLDMAFITFNKLCTSIFTYHLLRFVWYSGSPGEVLWSVEDFSFVQAALGLVCLFVVYDFFYTLFHMALHHRSVYKYIHKHHHRQVCSQIHLLRRGSLP